MHWWLLAATVAFIAGWIAAWIARGEENCRCAVKQRRATHLIARLGSLALPGLVRLGPDRTERVALPSGVKR